MTSILLNTIRPLSGQTAIVTGSTSGIGEAIARALAEQGANIVLNGFGNLEEIVGEKQPNKKPATPAQIGALAAFLCSDDAAAMTGSPLPIDGGWTIESHGPRHRMRCLWYRIRSPGDDIAVLPSLLPRA